MPKFNPNPSPLEVARRNAGLTRKKLGEITGISFRSIESYEQGKDNINLAACATVRKLAHALGVSIEDVMNDEEA